IGYLLDDSAQDGTRGGSPPARFHGIDALGDFEVPRAQTMMRREMQVLAIEAKNMAELRLAQPGRAFCDRVENRLGIVRRAGDDPQDLAGRGLLFERFRKRFLDCQAGRTLPRLRFAPATRRRARPGFDWRRALTCLPPWHLPGSPTESLATRRLGD